MEANGSQQQLSVGRMRQVFTGKRLWLIPANRMTFGCLAWVNILKAKCKKRDELAIPAIFVRYNEEHKGWKFLAPSHNQPIFWSNSAQFLQDKSWNNHTDAIPIQDTDALYYKDTTDIKNFGYDNIDEHDKELQQPINNIYWLPSEADTAFEGDIIFPEPTDAVFEYPANEIDNASEFDPPTAPSAQASDGSADNGQKSTTSLGAPPPLKELDRDVQDHAFSEHLSMQKAQYYHNKFAATHKMFPWLHPMTLAELFQIYPRMFLPAAEMHCFQEKLQHSGRLADIGPLPAYDTNTHMVFAMNLKPSIKEALGGGDQGRDGQIGEHAHLGSCK
ncbi:uncharacterized protein UHOD_20028 [Ustilago sp. UG-2017b]|nr:uncharacterized protein UHOD_20028 [Ustilago sp. UG-2017b]